MGLRMPTLWKHPDSGTYYLFERVPTRLRDAAQGKSVLLLVDGQACRVKLGQHVKLSLRTKDIATAKERYRDASAALQEHLRV